LQNQQPHKRNDRDKLKEVIYNYHHIMRMNSIEDFSKITPDKEVLEPEFKQENN
ncbi:unnamed protein product, partial [marine sediment metagenome]